MSDRLKGARVLVIGGSSGIGLATAAAAAEDGGSVTIASRSKAKLDEALARIGGGARAVVLDTGDEAAVERFFAGEDAWDHVVVSAAQTTSGPVRTFGLADAKVAMESKFWGAYRVARAAKIREGGSLTFVSGLLSVRPSASSVLQGAINAALEALARWLALELAPIRVNTVSPGLIDTPLWSRMPKEKREAMFARAVQRLPVRRIGQPEDIADAVLFLATTPFVTGSTVRVDGGAAIA
jgi:NAD(P)-dependent dehydrogenase (short-subunit alcohol dehydrogenase family)